MSICCFPNFLVCLIISMLDNVSLTFGDNKYGKTCFNVE